MKSFRIFTILMFFCFITAGSTILAQDQNTTAQQQAWLEYMTPSAGHNVLADHAGEWKTITTFWMDPAAPPQKYEGSARNEMIMGGRYLKSYYTGNMMGMPFEGMSLEGYDNAKKEYTSIWVDNFGTGTSISTGKYDEKIKSIIYKGTVYDPMAGKDTPIKEIIKTIDKDHHVMEMYSIIDGKEIKTMEVSFERKM
jgi:Protein of unknown function (DUF1579)